MSNLQKNKEALAATLSSLEHLKIDPKRLSMSEEIDSIFSGYCEVKFAVLDETSRVAVKVLRPTGKYEERTLLAVRLARELKIWSGLAHPNILPLVGFYLDEKMKIAQLISPFESHGHIGEYLKTNPVEATRFRLAIDTITGLEYLHSLNPPICHGDLKASNVLVGADGRAMLCDLGLAVAIAESSGLTTSGAFRGTTRYLSPELLSKAKFFRTLESDIWAWACLLVEVTCDVSPYCKFDNSPSIIAAMLQGEPPARLEELRLQDPVRALVKQCWNTVADSRPTARECLEVLHVFVERVGNPVAGEIIVEEPVTRYLGDADSRAVVVVAVMWPVGLGFFFFHLS